MLHFVLSNKVSFSFLTLQLNFIRQICLNMSLYRPHRMVLLIICTFFIRSGDRCPSPISVPTFRSSPGDRSPTHRVAAVSVSTSRTIRNPAATSGWKTTDQDHFALNKDRLGNRDLARCLNRLDEMIQAVCLS